MIDRRGTPDAVDGRLLAAAGGVAAAGLERAGCCDDHHQRALPAPHARTIAAAVPTTKPGLTRRACGAAASSVAATTVGLIAYTRTGRAIFLTCCSPRSSKAYGSLSRI